MPVNNDYLRILEDLETEKAQEEIRDSLRRSNSINAALRAEAIPLAEREGLDVLTVERNIEKLRQVPQREDVDIEAMMEVYPKVSELFKNPDNAAIMYDSLDILKGLELANRETERTWAELGTDSLLGLSRGTISFGEGLVGLADIPTFGYTSDILEAIGYDPDATQKILGDLYSDKMKQAIAKAVRAEGFVETAGTYLDEPELLLNLVLETTPTMLGIAGGARVAALKMLKGAGIKAGTKEAVEFLARPGVREKFIKAAATGSAIAEGAITAGGIYSQTTGEGATWAEAVIPSILGGIGTGLISKYSSAILPDLEASLATGILTSGRQGLIEAGKAVGKGIIKEGALEEMPQSAQEQVWINLATGRPLTEGVPEAAATGLVAGSAMGGAFTLPTVLMGALDRTTDDVHDYIGSTTDQMFLDDVIAFAQGNDLKDLSPEKYVEALKGIIGSERTVYLDTSALDEVPAPLGKFITQTGDLEIPLTDFLEMVGKDEEFLAAVRPHVRLDPGAYSQNELQFNDLEQYAKKLIDDAKVTQDALTEAERIFEDVRDQLVATGRQSTRTAQYSAQIIPAYVSAAAERTGLSVDEVYEKMGFQVAKEPKQTDTGVEILEEQDFENATVDLSREVDGIEQTYRLPAQEVWDDLQSRRGKLNEYINCLRGG